MKKVLVIGDSCEDVFQYGNCERLSPEAPIPIFKPANSIKNDGMASNVYANLVSLGVDCDIITNRIKPTKTRYVDKTSNQMIVRVDINDRIDPIKQSLLDNLINLDAYDAIVISDYNKGFLDDHNIEYISNNHPLTFLDTKKKIRKWANNIKFIKINNIEYKNNIEYLDLYYRDNLIITLGDRGAFLKNKGVKKEFIMENNHPIRDLSGAGDTFLAGLVADYLKNNDIRSAIKFANKCASWAVSQRGVVRVSLEDILS